MPYQRQVNHSWGIKDIRNDFLLPQAAEGRSIIRRILDYNRMFYKFFSNHCVTLFASKSSTLAFFAVPATK